MTQEIEQAAPIMDDETLARINVWFADFSSAEKDKSTELERLEAFFGPQHWTAQQIESFS